MAISAASLSKKTKNEILDEYQKLLSTIEDAKIISKTALSPSSLECVAKANEFNSELIEKEGSRLEGDMKSGFNDFLARILELRKELSFKLENELKKFNELQSAIEVSKMLLKNNYHIEVAAESLNRLVEEYAEKKKELSASLEKIREDFEREISLKKAEWERQIEEWNYSFKQKKQREDEALNEESARREKEWLERETLLKAEESEIAKLKIQAEKFPEILASELAKREKEISEQRKSEHANTLNFKEQEWAAREQVSKLKIDNLESQIKKLEAEVIVLKKEQELANRKAQEMAIKVIESGAAKYKSEEGEKSARSNAIG